MIQLSTSQFDGGIVLLSCSQRSSISSIDAHVWRCLLWRLTLPCWKLLSYSSCQTQRWHRPTDVWPLIRVIDLGAPNPIKSFMGCIKTWLAWIRKEPSRYAPHKILLTRWLVSWQNVEKGVAYCTVLLLLDPLQDVCELSWFYFWTNRPTNGMQS